MKQCMGISCNSSAKAGYLKHASHTEVDPMSCKEKFKECKTLNLKQKRAKFRVKTPMPALSHIIY